MKKEIQSRVRHLVGVLERSYRDHAEIIKVDTGELLNHGLIIGILEKLKALIFPGYFGKRSIPAGCVEYYAGGLLEEVLSDFPQQVARALCYRTGAGTEPEGGFTKLAGDIVFEFLSSLPRLREFLADDVEATFDGDPAAYSKDEIISSYPGIFAIMVSRAAHELYRLDVPLIPRIMTEYAHGLTGIDIHPGAVLGRHFFIDHGTGIVIGETTVIGDNVKVYQGVTLGALSTRGGQALKTTKRHPTIEDNVTIYSGATILGGGTVIGEGVIIGSNSFVTRSVPAKTRVSVKNELQLKGTGQGAWEHREFLQETGWDYVI
jgi:serine O-acetyltransferase